MMIMLNIRERGLQMRLVVVIDQRDGAGNDFVAEFLPVLDQTVAHHIADGQGAVIITFLLRHLVKLLQ